MDEFHSSVAKCLVGVVRVDISSLVYQNEVEPRQIDDNIISKLVHIFATKGCERDKPENHISAIISSTDLDYILQASQVTRDDLQRSLLGGRYPKLNTLDKKICYLHGRHRLKAAMKFFKNSQPGNHWWTIKLSSFEPENHYRADFLLDQVEKFSHETKFSDGEVYRKIRYYQQQAREELVKNWMIQLTNCKRVSISQMLKDEDLVKAFDMLLVFPGLWKGLELGNIQKHQALHCDEEILHYLGHIYKTWNEITLGNPVIQQAVDIQTVQNLQSRAPSVSITDRNYIIRKMDSRALFSAIEDGNLRELVKEALLRLRVIIPTIKSFHENLKYFEIGVKILKTHLLNGPIETTMYRTMYSQWSLPEDILVEFREGEFQHASIQEEDIFAHFAYKQVFISALRQFPSLSECAPRLELKQTAIRGIIDPVYSSLFLARAQLLGFRTEKILSGLGNASEITAAPYVEPMSGLNSNGEMIKRRWGRPFSNAYKQFRTQLFLPNLPQAQAEVSLNPSVMFIQQDFLNAFLGPTPEITVTSTITVSAVTAQQSPVIHDRIPAPAPRAQVPLERIVVPEQPVAPSHTEVQLASETQYPNVQHEPSVLTGQSPGSFVSLEPAASSEQAAREILTSPGMGELLDRFSRTTMEFGREVQSPSNTVINQDQSVEMTEQHRSFISVNSMTSEVHENTMPNDQLDEVDNSLTDDNESHITSRASLEINTLEAGVLQGHRSFLTPEPLVSPISAAGTDGSYSSELQSPPAVMASQRLRSFLLPESSGSPTSQSHQRPKPWNSQDHPSFLTSRPLSSLSLAASAEDHRLPEIQSLHSEVSRNHRSFLIPESGSPLQGHRSFLPPETNPASATTSQTYHSFLAPETSTASTAITQTHRSFLMPNSPITGVSRSNWLSKSSIHQTAGNLRDHRSFLNPESQLTGQASSIADPFPMPSRRFEFIEYNGMRKTLKSMQDIDQYLQQRKGWIGMVIRQRTAKTIRFDHIVKHMMNNGPSQNESYALVKAPFAEQFRRNLVKITRSAENNKDGSDFASSSNNKRLKN